MSPPRQEMGLAHYEALLGHPQAQSAPAQNFQNLDELSQHFTQEPLERPLTSGRDRSRSRDGSEERRNRKNRAPAKPVATAQSAASTDPNVDPGFATTPSVMTEAEISEFSEICLEAGISLRTLAKKARAGEISGSLLDSSEVALPRFKAIKWFMSQFSAFGYRDEWLADAVFYMDRLAVAMHTCEDAPVPKGRPKLAAAWTMGYDSLWLGCMYTALKMSEAESELDVSLVDLLLPLVQLKEGEKVSRTRLTQIKKAEIFATRQLDYKLIVPTALQLTQHMAREICQAVQKSEEAPAWEGLKILRLPQLLGPPLKNQTEEERQNKAHPARPLCMLQVLSSLLLDLAIVHRPGAAYGEKLPAGALALAVVRLALYGFGSEPPQSSTAKLAQLQEELELPENVTDDTLSMLTACLYRLWANTMKSSPVLQKWKRRMSKDDPSAVLPAAPAKALLPLGLQESLDFNTPQRKQQEPKVLSATPCRMEKLEKEFCTPRKPTLPPGLRIGARLTPQAPATPASGVDEAGSLRSPAPSTEPPVGDLPTEAMAAAIAESSQSLPAPSTEPPAGSLRSPAPSTEPPVGSSQDLPSPSTGLPAGPTSASQPASPVQPENPMPNNKGTALAPFRNPATLKRPGMECCIAGQKHLASEASEEHDSNMIASEASSQGSGTSDRADLVDGKWAGAPLTRSKYSRQGSLKLSLGAKQSPVAPSNSIEPARASTRLQARAPSRQKDPPIMEEAVDETSEVEEESEYRDGDDSDGGSDCHTDGITKSKRKVKAQRGIPKSAGRSKGTKRPRPPVKSKSRPPTSRPRTGPPVAPKETMKSQIGRERPPAAELGSSHPARKGLPRHAMQPFAGEVRSDTRHPWRLE